MKFISAVRLFVMTDCYLVKQQPLEGELFIICLCNILVLHKCHLENGFGDFFSVVTFFAHNLFVH